MLCNGDILNSTKSPLRNPEPARRYDVYRRVNITFPFGINTLLVFFIVTIYGEISWARPLEVLELGEKLIFVVPNNPVSPGVTPIGRQVERKNQPRRPARSENDNGPGCDPSRVS
jgi:hypothetical protein